MENKKQTASYLTSVANKFNEKSDYEKYVYINEEFLNNTYDSCLNAAKKGNYEVLLRMTCRYDDPDKEHLIKYFKDLGFEVELYEPGLIKGSKKIPTIEELRMAPFRNYILHLSWK